MAKKRLCRWTFLASGRKIPRTGGVILANYDDADVLQNYLAQDPFRLSGVAKVDLVPFEPTMMVTELKAVL